MRVRSRRVYQLSFGNLRMLYTSWVRFINDVDGSKEKKQTKEQKQKLRYKVVILPSILNKSNCTSFLLEDSTIFFNH